ncbi:MAG: hypothetical protein KAR19_18135 [Bacteroidales bacterium]|nr:hypothetical protein [Bacteroidales bacterium]
MKELDKGTYGYDSQFLGKHQDVIELKDGESAIALVPAYQGRVMTSTCEGENGFSFGWMNYELIESGETLEHFNPIGGEERFWIGPEGGQFSVYFKAGTDFVFDNWYVPAPIDTEPFELVSHNETMASLKKEMTLENYSGIVFNLEVLRNVILLSGNQIDEYLNISSKNSSVVAYETSNTIINTGQKNWEKESGLLSIWILGMLIPSQEVTVVIPVKEGDSSELGPEVNDDYFGKISDERLKVSDNKVFFRADGKSRGKIGIPPLRTARFMGSYDSQNQALTIVECPLPENNTDFVNSAWELQENPYKGDAFNSYNDGPLEDGSQMGPFYELESSSPALSLDPGDSYTHLQRTYHFKGDESSLDKIAIEVLKVSLKEIEDAF